MSGPSLYEILGLEPNATPAQIEKAHRFYEVMYGDGALATYSLLDDQEAARAREQLREAYETLSDPERRHEYDVAHGLASEREPLLRFAASVADADVPRPESHPAPAALPDPVTGPDLCRVREEQGITLRAIAEETKVGVRFLEYIEQDRHALLPADVYLKGFLREYARCVGLDPGPTAESYMKRVER
jgi:flagellar biosynthesis protein FlhG